MNNLQNKKITFRISTNIAAVKKGNIVTVRIDMTQSDPLYAEQGWNLIGTLPEEIRPDYELKSVCYDNTASSESTNIMYDLKLVPSGDITVYSFEEKGIRPMGYFTYVC